MCSINAANGGATFSQAFKLIKQHRVRLNTECTMGNSAKESLLLKLIVVDAKTCNYYNFELVTRFA